ncbi:MAG TPA: hypothetical protein VM600_05385 [Actinomycetota bacterium]|nr:hypothetical protein [Actinomycetota bacterium]
MTRSRFVALAVALAVTLMPSAPALGHSGQHNFRLEAPIPCGPACGAVLPSGTIDLCSENADPMTYDEIVTEAAPLSPEDKMVVLRVDIYPSIDWDLVICEQGPEMGSADIIDEMCNHHVPYPIGVSCQESMWALATPGQTYRIRGLNRYDIAPCPGRYSWVIV